ncbi:MAG: hypothetical protein WC279_12105 [Sulfurimonas sp.]|jgi:hypothetical protein|uniref:hypothetical protein n=1 Tax=Sulfurimonas sp. TaxID=2022749 RepID=UPI002A4314BF|nr:hypothetical protein [Dehalococcoidales bacterium]
MFYFQVAKTGNVRKFKKPQYPCITSLYEDFDRSAVQVILRYRDYLKDNTIEWSKGLILAGTGVYQGGTGDFCAVHSAADITLFYGYEIPDKVSGKGQDLFMVKEGIEGFRGLPEPVPERKVEKGAAPALRKPHAPRPDSRHPAQRPVISHVPKGSGIPSLDRLRAGVYNNKKRVR